MVSCADLCRRSDRSEGRTEGTGVECFAANLRALSSWNLIRLRCSAVSGSFCYLCVRRDSKAAIDKRDLFRGVRKNQVRSLG